MGKGYIYIARAMSTPRTFKNTLGLIQNIGLGLIAMSSPRVGTLVTRGVNPSHPLISHP